MPTAQPTDPAPILAPSATATRAQPPTSAPAPTAAHTAAPTPTLAPAATPTRATPEAAWIGKVALVKTEDRAEGVRRALELLDADVDAKRILLKPNFNSADPAPGSTHPDVLRTLITGLKQRGAGAITIGDRSGMGNTRTVMQQLGAFDMARELGCEMVVFDELAEDQWGLVQEQGDHWSRGFAVPKLLLAADAVVQTCNLKTHRFGGHFTLSLKNSVGFAAKQVGGRGYNYMNELHGSDFQRHMIAEINRVYRPALVVMDAVEAFADGGPDRGRVVRPGVVLASADRVAIDAVGVAILRLFGTTREVSQGRVFEQAQIARAVELGLGADRPDAVEIIPADDAAATFTAQIRNLLS
jgi:uncharacterized protein (DUF362 family)